MLLMGREPLWMDVPTGFDATIFAIFPSDAPTLPEVAREGSITLSVQPGPISNDAAYPITPYPAPLGAAVRDSRQQVPSPYLATGWHPRHGPRDVGRSMRQRR
jgi:hypothetical protein